MSTVRVPDWLQPFLVGFVVATVLLGISYAIGRGVDDDPHWRLKGEFTVLPQAEGGVEQVKCHYVAGTFDEEAVDIWLPANFYCPPSLHSI